MITGERVWTFVCQSCEEEFRSSPYQNAFCQKCGIGHILCEPCRFVHEMPASKQDWYLNGLESSPEFYGL